MERIFWLLCCGQIRFQSSSQEFPHFSFLFKLRHCMTPTAASFPLLRDLPSCPRGHLLVQAAAVQNQPVCPITLASFPVQKLKKGKIIKCTFVEAG